MANLYELNVLTRTDFGKAATRRMRRTAELVPAIIYGGKDEPTPITIPHNVAHHALEHEAFYSHILTLQIDGKKKEQVILKDVQRHPSKPRIQHLDFFRINMSEKLNMTLPIHFINADTAPGVLAGGVVSHNINELEIRCLPGDLPEYIEIDLSNLELEGALHLTQLKLPKGVELLALAHGDDHAHDHVVVSIHVPTVYVEPEEAAPAEGAAAGEGEKPEASEGSEAKPAED
ncbi:MAG: 50S ribosomal protein L25/general stress protein Ctc [Pseudomonadota bacterium]|nr:50S ribosomal protein L25/general stress protein Ctc [Pseudomonadota bacterium]